MKKIIQGEKIKISDYIGDGKLQVKVSIQSHMNIDVTCFGLNEDKKLEDDRYMIFYNQIESPQNEIKLLTNNNTETIFDLTLNDLPQNVKNLVFTASIDGEGKMSNIDDGFISILKDNEEVIRYGFNGHNFKNEKAIIISEIYFKTLWRMGAVGRGFNGGLPVLLTHFGGEIDSHEKHEEEKKEDKTVSLKKVALHKLMEKEAPKLLSLTKKATVSLKKVNLDSHSAKVALCLDISGSMSSLYSSGKIQEFAERILGLGCNFDDDGQIDIFLFGRMAHNAGEMSVSNWDGYVKDVIKEYPLEGGTYYGKVMKRIRDFYFPRNQQKTVVKGNIPVYVMFITDGATMDKQLTITQIQESSYEPIFWQFMAIGKSSKDITQKGIGGFFKRAFASDFTFLENLDNMEDRYIDNADFFSVEDPSFISDKELYDLLMEEYPSWLKEAKRNGLL